MRIRAREIWKRVDHIIQGGHIYYPKFPTYISSHGRVKRTFKGNAPDLIYLPEYDRSGYVQVSLKCYDENGNDVRKYVKVHRLVAYYFISNNDASKDIVNHLLNPDTGMIDVSDNYYKLLEWTDLSGNQKYAVDNDRSNFGTGELNHSHKLTETDVYDILKLINSGYGDTKISKIYNLNPETIRQIRLGCTWKHIPRNNDCTSN